MKATLSAEIGRLTPVEKLRLVEELWNWLAANPDQIPLPDWHVRALAEDESTYHAAPDGGSDWPAAKARISGKM